MRQDTTKIVRNDEHWCGMELAGGLGSRLRIGGATPKQFAPKFPGVTFIQDITRMNTKVIKPARIFPVVTTDKMVSLASKQLTSLDVPTTNILNKHKQLGYVLVQAKSAWDIYRIDPEAVVFITPTDQHIIGEEEYAEDIKQVMEYAAKGHFVLIGVKVSDANIVGGCGNVVYDNAQEGPFYKIEKFVEKPLKKAKTPEEGMEAVKKLLLADNSVVNTGLYAAPVKMICEAFPEEEIDEALRKLLEENPEKTDCGIDPEEMMRRLNAELYVGHFKWADCGTLAAYFEIQKHTPNHGNASIGEITRYNCRDSLFVSSTKGLHMYASNIRGGIACIAYASESGGIDVAVINMEESQEAGKVANFFDNSERASYSYNSENCMVMPSNISDSCKVAFLGVKNIFVFINRLDNGDINVNISANGECINKVTE